ncbi:hypothetical protein TNCV_1664881 [Trichonephila clavipes]|uniref:Uncharacterized protein n=1 Tax=Trichonephila clavipes TaxID=2585209 RepID=A0A8X6RSX5_TRICX|nr:hypothetical protein TNCV_1664881 [Trichonephila clavipes]
MGRTLNNHPAASPLVRCEDPDHPEGVRSLKTEEQPSQITLSSAWCSKLRLTTSIFSMKDFSSSSFLPTETGRVDSVDRRSPSTEASQLVLRMHYPRSK